MIKKIKKNNIEDKEDKIIDLHLKSLTQDDISTITKTSLRDVNRIISKYRKEQEIKKQEQNYNSISSQAYTLYSKGRSTLQVAIELQIRQPLADQLFEEYLKLNQNHQLFPVYNRLVATHGTNAIGHFIKLCELCLSVGFTEQKIIRTIEIANGDLRSIESDFKIYAVEVNDLKIKKQIEKNELGSISLQKANLSTELVNATRQLELLYKTVEDQIKVKMHLQKENAFLLRSIEQMENEDNCYLRVRKGAEELVSDILKDKENIIKLVIYSVMEYLKNPSHQEEFIVNIKTLADLENNFSGYRFHNKPVKLGNHYIEGYGIYDDEDIKKVYSQIRKISEKSLKTIISNSAGKETFTDIIRDQNLI